MVDANQGIKTKIIDLGADPSNLEPVKNFLREKENEIQILNKRLDIFKLLSFLHYNQTDQMNFTKKW